MKWGPITADQAVALGGGVTPSTHGLEISSLCLQL